MHRQALWKAIFVALATLGTSATYADFIDDSQVQLKFKNFYLQRDVSVPDEKKPLSRNFGSWSQGITLDAKSGYADLGPLKLGVDVFAQYALRLSDDKHMNDFVLPYNGQDQARDYGKVGLTLKAKLNKTELRVGDLQPMTPVLFIDPSRQLITAYSGVWLESKELKNTKLTLAYIDGINSRYDNQYQDFNIWPKELGDYSRRVNSGFNHGMYIAGLDYQIMPELSASYYFADVTNLYQQNYVGLDFKKKLDDKNQISGHIHGFDNRETGSAIYGDFENQALSLKGEWKTGNHTFDMGYQQMFGEHGTGVPYFPSLSGWAPQPYLANWSVASFIRKDEKSWSVGYSYDFKDLGINGLTATARHFEGWNIDNGDGTRGKEAENNLIVKYTVPEGKFKGLGIQWMYIDVNYPSVPGFVDLEENRITTTYTFTF